MRSSTDSVCETVPRVVPVEPAAMAIIVVVAHPHLRIAMRQGESDADGNIDPGIRPQVRGGQARGSRECEKRNAQQ